MNIFTDLKNIGLTDTEASVIDRMLAKGSAADQSVYKQLAKGKVVRRERTGTGFFTYFEIPESVPKTLHDDGAYGDVSAYLKDVPNGAGFMLMIEKGKVRFLEGYAYADPWPDSEQITRFFDENDN